MGYDKLERNLIDIVKEEQAKLLAFLRRRYTTLLSAFPESFL